MHAVLRTDITSHFSIYRLLMPLTLTILLFKIKKSIPVFIFVMAVLLYSFILTSFYTNNYYNYIISALHYISILNIFLIVSYLCDHQGFDKIYTLLNKFIIFSIFIAFLELIFNFRLPNTAIYDDFSVGAFFWNQNEFGTGLIAFLPILLVFEKKFLKKLFLIPVIIFLLYINDCKLALIATFICFCQFFLKKHLNIYKKYIKFFAVFFIIFILVLIIITPFENMLLSFRDYDISISDLLVMPIYHIASLSPLHDDGGSITVRTNAVIYSLQEFKSSYFFGIGIGNTLIMLEKNKYLLSTAKSLHNLPVQLLVENGFWMFFIYLYLLYNYIKILFTSAIHKFELLFLIALPTILIGSMTSSIGIFSNYFFIACLFFILKAFFFKRGNLNGQNEQLSINNNTFV